MNYGVTGYHWKLCRRLKRVIFFFCFRLILVCYFFHLLFCVRFGVSHKKKKTNFFSHSIVLCFLLDWLEFLGGYYTIEQTKSRLRIVALNTNFMRHDSRMTQTSSAAVRQRPGNVNDFSEHGNYRYHHGYHYRNNGINGYNSAMGVEHGGTVSALSGGDSHESQKQWEWLEDVLAKSQRNKETVSRYSTRNIRKKNISATADDSNKCFSHRQLNFSKHCPNAGGPKERKRWKFNYSRKRKINISEMNKKQKKKLRGTQKSDSPSIIFASLVGLRLFIDRFVCVCVQKSNNGKIAKQKRRKWQRNKNLRCFNHIAFDDFSFLFIRIVMLIVAATRISFSIFLLFGISFPSFCLTTKSFKR